MHTNLIKKIRPLNNDEKRFFPVEMMIKDMTSWEQYAKTVINCTSRYNISFSISYAPVNLVGKYTKYPSYGDFPETYCLVSSNLRIISGKQCLFVEILRQMVETE